VVNTSKFLPLFLFPLFILSVFLSKWPLMLSHKHGLIRCPSPPKISLRRYGATACCGGSYAGQQCSTTPHLQEDSLTLINRNIFLICFGIFPHFVSLLNLHHYLLRAIPSRCPSNIRMARSSVFFSIPFLHIFSSFFASAFSFLVPDFTFKTTSTLEIANATTFNRPAAELQ
jgi:hypothetical protein